MPVYQYTARDSEGTHVEGELLSHNEESVVVDLESKQLTPIAIQLQESKASVGVSGRISIRALGTFYRQLSDLMRSGVPILRALALLSRGKSNPKLSGIIGEITSAVSEGEALADAMVMHREVFPSVHIAMVRAGEHGGFLEEVLARLASFLAKQAELRSTVIGALIYPIVLVSMGFAIIGVVMVVFVPKFKMMLEGLDLPIPTRIVLGTSDLLSNHGLLTLGLVVGVVLLFLWLRSQEKVREGISLGILRVPMLGSLLKQMAVSRFCRILGTLLANGIPILKSMEISREAAGNPLLVEAIDIARESVQSGETLADPLEQSGLFEADIIEIIRIGESANNLDTVLISIAEMIETRVDRLLTTVVRLLEPALLLLLGLVLLFIILALVVPLVMLSASV